MKLDILAFGVHPDDVELSCGGTLMMEKLKGKKVGVIDMTRGELGTRGTAETRMQEAALAAKIMDLDIRENLGMADGFFANDKEHQLKVVEVMRKYQPEIVIANAFQDRHPDHGRSARLVSDAAFLSGLRKVETIHNHEKQEAWRPSYVFHFIQDRFLNPHFVFDITEVFERKVEAIKAYGTQFFNPELNEPESYISTPDYLDSIIYRHKMLGKMIGVPYAEGFMAEKMIGIRSFDSLIQNVT